MSTQSTTPTRENVPTEHRWNLDSLFASDSEWEAALQQLNDTSARIPEFRGTLGNSARALHDCLQFMMQLGELEERLGYYAHLRYAEDAGNSDNQARYARFMQLSARIQTEAAYQSPEIQAIPNDRIADFLADDILQEYRIYLERLLRYKPHILSEPEERLLAMQAESNQTAQKTFSALTDVDMEFGTIDTPEGPRALTHSSFGALMQHRDRGVRQAAYERFYTQFEGHRNTLASLYNGSVQLDVYKAKARGFESARASRLFADDVPEQVYDTLIEQVHQAFPALHRYYRLRAERLGLAKLRLYDVKVPLVPDVTLHHSYEEAVDLLQHALQPLGQDYVTTLTDGLLNGWVDRYENKGKRSGAFSAGSYHGDPYILMNYKDDVLRDVFTLAHEAGHSMHSYYSVRSNPFQHYQYTIFEAEVASTFNEQLLFAHLLQKYADDPRITAYLINLRIDDMLATLIRQTMFAEFEHLTHQMVENGTPLTIESLRTTYADLQQQYFGPSVTIEPPDDLEGLRIPHFYRAFYVYKYATGISAAVTLARRVLDGTPGALDSYYTFLRSGGSRFPLDSLAAAGADMRQPEPVATALQEFSGLIEQLESALQQQ
ncbi:oligoendopeptidase F [Spirochaeta africana]|uniref:Oligopeptidase F n=1 Tax=Spirochaeta africana (strain ATCC 700263 / DSM 8902 / Z-7692) TaxID=889378 RepID=H9UI73_SPIAZ|nr:oligoendopeptidase F [Spirochaeta africana]AFG37216.1 oligoendopeptidase F [Spirochaeta africana DSM 8902]